MIQENPQRQGGLERDLGKFRSFMILALGKDLEKKLPGVSQGRVAPYTLSMSPPALSLVAWP